jgi:uncharacterized membrane protein YjjB (DUF3815 family)
VLTEFIAALNNVQPRVWAILQFIALLGVVSLGGYLAVNGHTAEGTSLMTGAFALLKFEVLGDRQ